MWEKILKFEIRNFRDAARAGKEYALEDYYESILLSEEEYQKLSSREKKNIHQKLYHLLNKYGKNSWAKKRKQFHSTTGGRAESGKESTMLPTEDFKPSQRRRTKEEIEAERRKKQQRREERKRLRERGERLKLRPTIEREQRAEQRKTRSQMIIDYFTMWRNMYNRLPTLTEITNSEGRPLTVDEERTFNEEYAKRTQE